jgi:8-oxo-dGTP diphosphatase
MAHPTYVACEVLAGTARVADAEELDAVEWVPIGELASYVHGGFYSAVQEHLDAALEDS